MDRKRPCESAKRKQAQQPEQAKQAAEQAVVRVEGQRARADVADMVVAEVEQFPILLQAQFSGALLPAVGGDLRSGGDLEALGNQ
jgi:DNA-binding protein Fis